MCFIGERVLKGWLLSFFTEHISRKIIQPQAGEANIIKYKRIAAWISLFSSRAVMFSIFLYMSLCRTSLYDLPALSLSCFFFFFCCAWLFPRWTSIFLSIQKMTAFSQIIWWKKLKIMWTENLKINFLVDNQITLKLHFIYKNVVNKYQSIPRASYYIGKPQ